MVLVNYTTRELTAKIVFYGPGLCGKTTNLQYIFDSLPPEKKGKMISLATKTDRTLFFDFLPLDLGTIKGMRTRIQLYTVPGQVFYNETRKLVLRGADGIVFVADSNRNMMDANLESLQNLRDNLAEYDIDLNDLPLVLQYNKRDLPNIYSVEELDQALRKDNPAWPSFEAVAIDGTGVHESLKAISKLVLRHLAAKFSAGAATERPVLAPAAAPTPKPAPAPPPPKIEVPKVKEPVAAPAPPAERPIELEPPAAEDTRVSIGGKMSDDEYATFYGSGGVQEMESAEEEPVPVEKEPGAVSIGGEMSDDDYAAFYGGSGVTLPDEEQSWEEEDSITIDAGSEDAASQFLQSDEMDIGGGPEISVEPEVEVDDFKEWVGGDPGVEEEPITLDVEEDDDAFVLDATEEEPEPAAPPEVETPPAPARRPAPEIRAEQAVEVPIPLALVGGRGEITRTVVVPLKFTSPSGEQILELKLELHLRPRSD